MDKAKNRFKHININAFILTIYLLIVWLAFLSLFVADNKFHLLIFISVFGIVIYIGAIFLLETIEKITLKDNNIYDKRKGIIVFAGTIFFTLIILVIWYIGYYPGCFSPDSISQYGQAVSGAYSDWHPVWHTLVFFTLPLKLFGSYEFIVLLQIIYFSLIMGYISLIIYRYAGIKYCIMTLAYILFNPYTGNILLYPWKDVGFAMGSMLATGIGMDYYFSKNKTEMHIRKILVLGFVLANTTLFRHNAILLTAPMIVALGINMDKRLFYKLLMVFVITLVVIKGPVYYFLSVEKPEKRITESVGLPLTIIANVAQQTPYALDEEMSEFVYSIATKEQRAENYICGNFNSIKWSGANTTVVEEIGLIPILRITIKCFIYSPIPSFKALFALTDMVYGLENGIEGDIVPSIAANNYGISANGNSAISDFLQSYTELINQTFLVYFKHIGMSILLMIIAILAKIKWRSEMNLKKMSLCLPILVYNFGTMLLLTGPNSRFFYVSFLVCPLVIILALKEEEKVYG